MARLTYPQTLAATVVGAGLFGAGAMSGPVLIVAGWLILIITGLRGYQPC